MAFPSPPNGIRLSICDASIVFKLFRMREMRGHREQVDPRRRPPMPWIACGGRKSQDHVLCQGTDFSFRSRNVFAWIHAASQYYSVNIIKHVSRTHAHDIRRILRRRMHCRTLDQYEIAFVCYNRCSLIH